MNTKIMNKKTSILLITSSLCVASFAQSDIPNAGLLAKEVEQAQPKSPVKPTGDLFQAPSSSAAMPTNDMLFQLKQIEVMNLNGENETAQLASLINPYLKKQVGLADLNQLTEQITQHYRQQGYLLAKAILPPQQIADGRLEIKLIKGELGDIQINNESHLNKTLLQKIIQTNLNKPLLKKQDLESLALNLNEIKGVQSSLNLKSGKTTGKTDLTVQLDNSKGFLAYAMLDNQGNKDTGRYRLSLGATAYNLLGFADNLNLNLLSSQNANLKSIRADYSAMINGYASRLGMSANYLNYKLGGNFKDLDAVGYSHQLGVYFKQPLWRSAKFNLNSKLDFNHQKLKDKQQAVNLIQERQINTTTLSLDGSWQSLKNATTSFTLSTTFGNSKASEYSGGNKAKHLNLVNYSLSHEQYLPYDFSFNLNLNGQFTNHNLDSSQKFLLGGLYGVKGYKSGAVSVDEGHIFQAEIKKAIAIFSQSLLMPSIAYDYGFGKIDKKAQTEEKNSVNLQSVNLGLALITPNSHRLQLNIAKPIGKKLSNTDQYQVWFSALKTF